MSVQRIQHFPARIRIGGRHGWRQPHSLQRRRRFRSPAYESGARKRFQQKRKPPLAIRFPKQAVEAPTPVKKDNDARLRRLEALQKVRDGFGAINRRLSDRRHLTRNTSITTNQIGHFAAHSRFEQSDVHPSQRIQTLTAAFAAMPLAVCLSVFLLDKIRNHALEHLRQIAARHILQQLRTGFGVRPRPAADEDVHGIDDLVADLHVLAEQPDISGGVIATSCRTSRPMHLQQLSTAHPSYARARARS